MRAFHAVLLAFSLALLFGCTQGSIPSACANAAPEKLANCIYVNSVLDQNPYTCYPLSDATQKEKCLRDSSDSSVQKLVSGMSPSERDQFFAIVTGAISTALPGEEPSGATQQPQPPSSGAVTIPSGAASEADAQSYAQAVQANDMSPCVSISDASMRASCITQVALKVKKPEVCSSLTVKADLDLCNLYAKAGEQAK